MNVHPFHRYDQKKKEKENQKIKYKFNLEYNERTQILDNERDYYGNRFGKCSMHGLYK